MKKELITQNSNSISKLDLIRTRTFQFSLQKLVIFISVIVVSLYMLWDFNLFQESFLTKIQVEYPQLVWKFFIIFTVYMVAHPLVRSIAESYNRSIHSWISTLAFVAYIVCVIVFSENSKIKITNIDSIKLVHFAWLIPAVALPVLVKFIGVLLTWKLSPIQARKNIFLTLSLLCVAGVFTCASLLMYEVVILKKSFNLNHWKISLLVSCWILSALFGSFFTILGWWKYRKINFSNNHASIPLLVMIPIFLTVLIWMLKGTFGDADFNLTPELWFLVGCCVLVVGLVIYTFIFAKEIKSAKLMNAILSTALVAIWIGVFVYINYYGIVNKSYIVVDVAASASLVIFVLMALYDKTTKQSTFQEMLFTFMIGIMMLLIVFFTVAGKAKLFTVIIKFIPIDLKSLLPVLILICPGVYFVMSVTKIMWAQSRITHGVRIEKAIKKRNEQEALLKVRR